MPENQFKISDAEWRIMDSIWESSPLTSTQIIKNVKPGTDWSPKTIHSLIDRLVGKGALGVDRQCSPYQYYPLVSREQCVKKEMKTFARRFFNDSSFLMVASFIKENRMTPDEIDELRKMLDQKKD